MNRTLHILSISFLFFIIFVRSSDVCYSNVDIRGKSSNSTPVYKILNATGECIQQFNYFSKEFQSESNYCPSGLLSVDLSPVAFTPSSNTLPHVQLNISIMSHSEISAIFVRLQCLHAPDGEDVYCHDSLRMIVNGEWRWPCRGLLVDSQIDVPLVFGYECFRLYGLSQYYVNISVFPQNCRETFLLTSPPDTQLFPTIAKFYEQNLTNFQWSPVLFVDLTETDGVWFRISFPQELKVRSIVISIFDTSEKNEGAARRIDSYELIHPSTGVKWLNAAQGTYSVYAHVQRHDCLLFCDRTATACTTCVHTQLNFTLPEDVASLSWRGLRTIRDSGIGVIFLVLVVCLILVIAASSILYGKRRLMRPMITDLVMHDLKKLHIVYSDDCEEHSNVVLELVRLLEASNYVSTTIDQRDLATSGIRPANWMADSVKNADKILIIVSPLTSVLLDGNKLKQRRPYPDLFVSSYNLIINEWLSTTHNKNRFAVVIFPYSGPIPRQLYMLNLDIFEIPRQIGELFLFIQGTRNASSQAFLEDSAALLPPLQLAVASVCQMIDRNPTWSNGRIIYEENQSNNDINVPLRHKKLPANETEQALLCEELDLLVPDDDMTDRQPTVIASDLLERDDSSSTSD